MNIALTFRNNISQAWDRASRVFKGQTDRPKNSLRRGSVLLYSGITALTILQGCCATRFQPMNPENLVYHAHTVQAENDRLLAENAQCFELPQVLTQLDDKGTSPTGNFLLGQRISQMASAAGVKVCKSIGKGNNNGTTAQSRPKIGNDNSDDISGEIGAVWVPHLNAVFSDQKYLRANTLLHELLHALQAISKDALDGAKGKYVSGVQSMLLNEMAAASLEAIMITRQRLDGDLTLHNDLMENAQEDHSTRRAYLMLTSMIEKDPSLIQQLGDAETLPSPEILDKCIAGALTGYTMQPAFNLILRATSQHHKQLSNDHGKILNIQDNFDAVEIDETTAPALAFGQIYPGLKLPETVIAMNRLAPFIQSAVLVKLMGQSAGLTEEQARLIKAQYTSWDIERDHAIGRKASLASRSQNGSATRTGRDVKPIPGGHPRPGS